MTSEQALETLVAAAIFVQNSKYDEAVAYVETRLTRTERALKQILNDPYDHHFHAGEKVRRYKNLARTALKTENPTEES